MVEQNSHRCLQDSPPVLYAILPHNSRSCRLFASSAIATGKWCAELRRRGASRESDRERAVRGGEEPLFHRDGARGTAGSIERRSRSRQRRQQRGHRQGARRRRTASVSSGTAAGDLEKIFHGDGATYTPRAGQAGRICLMECGEPWTGSRGALCAVSRSCSAANAYLFFAAGGPRPWSDASTGLMRRQATVRRANRVAPQTSPRGSRARD